jgi:type IV pilus assembly protein PilM
MEILPKTLGTRPRLAVEIRTEGVIAARAEDASAVLSGLAHVAFADGSVAPSLKAGNITERSRVVAALRESLDSLAGRGGDRGRDVTVVVPDTAARVLLLEFDDLPGKAAEALPVIRFRLKKLLPFDADNAAVSYQVMSSERGAVRVLAVAMPREVLDEYEAAVTAAGYVPGAVLPSTVATLSCLDEHEAPALVVNAVRSGVTTAIVRNGVLLLHRTLDLGADASAASEIESAALVHTHDGPRGYDRIEAEGAIQTQVLEVAESAAAAREIAQAVSVAAAYFEDTLGATPGYILSAGTLGAEGLAAVLEENGLEGLKVQELVSAEAIGPGASTARVMRGWLAGVRGALRN